MVVRPALVTFALYCNPIFNGKSADVCEDERSVAVLIAPKAKRNRRTRGAARKDGYADQHNGDSTPHHHEYLQLPTHLLGGFVVC